MKVVKAYKALTSNVMVVIYSHSHLPFSIYYCALYQCSFHSHAYYTVFESYSGGKKGGRQSRFYAT